MKHPICISTGFVYKFSEDMNEKINILRNFPVDGIEVCFANAGELLDFSINKENLNYLQGLKFNSIHAPWQNVDYGENEKCRNVLAAIEKLYKQINARNVNFHIPDIEKVKETGIFNKYNFIFSIENDDGRRLGVPGLNTVEKIAKALTINKNFKFTFDFAHALATYSEEIPAFIDKFRNKLSQIHLAYLADNGMKDHYFLFKNDTPKLRRVLNYVKEVSVPIILECVATNKEEIKLIADEIDWLKKEIEL